MTFSQKIEQIKAKLNYIKVNRIKTFGCENHHFKFNKVIKIAEINAFEARHGINLPECYKAFLLNLGNGGAGPDYGIYPLAKWSDFQDWVFDDLPEDYLSRSSPLDTGWNEIVDEDNEAELQNLHQGLISIGTQGCTQMTMLVVSGKHQGKVVYTDANLCIGPYMCWDSDFLSWYERWLDEVIACNGTVEHFGYGIAGSPEQLIKITENLNNPLKQRSEALYSLFRFSSLPVDVLQKLPLYFNDPNLEIRQAIIAVMTKQKITCTDEQVIRWLNDHPTIIATIAPLALEQAPEKFKPLLWQQLLNTDDAKLADSLCRTLKLSEKEKCYLIENIRLTETKNQLIRCCYFQSEDHPLISRLLKDPSLKTRTTVIHRIFQLDLIETLPEIITLFEEILTNPLSEWSQEHYYQLENVLSYFSQPERIGKISEPYQRQLLPILIKIVAEIPDDILLLQSAIILILLGEDFIIPYLPTLLNKTMPARSDVLNSMIYTDTIKALILKHMKNSPNKKIAHFLGKKRTILNFFRQ